MADPSPAEVRAWARSRGAAVNVRGPLPAALVQAYVDAHPNQTKGTPVARVAAKKVQPRKARGGAPRKAPAETTQAPAEPTTAAPAKAASTAGSIDLAAGLRRLLTSVESEVREVSALSEQIDELVLELNERRDEQAKRLIVLDALRQSVDDASLGAFLEKAIRPRRTRVPEVIPERLTQA
jgi:hypothetical protein